MAKQKKKKVLSLNDLYCFFSNQNKSFSFSSKEDNSTIVVHVDEVINFSDTDDYNPREGLMKVHLKSCHLFRNRNKTYISEDSMNQAIPSFVDRPILGYIHKVDTDENGNDVYDFAGHEMIITEDEDGNEVVEYLEIPLGHIPESCHAELVYDKDNDKTYLELDGIIYEQYTKAAEILRRKGECAVSVELYVDELEYDAKESQLVLKKFHFTGITILGSDVKTGKEVRPGMQGSNITIADFSEENNSLFFQYEQKMLERLDKIETALANLQINNNEEGGNGMKFEQLLAKYNKTKEDITFEYENLSDEELEAKFAEVFGETEPVSEGDGEGTAEGAQTGGGDATGEGEGTSTDSEGTGEGEGEPTSEGEGVIEQNSLKPSKYSVTMSDGSVKEYSLSLSDISCALHELVNSTYGEADNTYYGVDVYEDGHVIMHDYWCGKHYKQTYNREDDNFSLTGDRVEVFANFLTKDEETKLNEMRSNYAEISEKLQKYQSAEEKNKKDALLSSIEYSSVADTEEFKALVKENTEKADMTFAEVEQKANSILLDYAKKGNLQFSEASHNGVQKKSFPVGTQKKKKAGYAGLFDGII